MADALEIACDESGSEGEKLVGGVTTVFAHASVRVGEAAAADCIRELRDRIRSPATEYKANHLFREKHRAVLEWLLGPSGPLLGRARVFLVDKEFFVVSRLVDLICGDGAAGDGAGGDDAGGDDAGDTGPTAVAVHRAAVPAVGRPAWLGFLEAVNYLLRPRNRRGIRVTVDDLLDVATALRPVAAGPVDGLLAAAHRAAPRLAAERTRQLDPGTAVPALDPLVPAIVAAVRHWGSGGRAVRLVHDRQSTLTDQLVAALVESCRPGPTGAGHDGSGGLAGMLLVDSAADPRVQLADFLAGAARKVATYELDGHGDEVLTGLLRPYLDPDSIWADEHSWRRLCPDRSPAVAPAR